MALISAGQVAQILGKTPQRTYELARLGLIPSVRLGRSISFDEVAIREWIVAGGKALPGRWKRQPSE